MHDPESFERAFVAMTYVLGRRGPELLDALSPGHTAARLAARLAAEDRDDRAAVLAPELARLITALDAGRAG